jgi:hypothetical protein
LTSLSLRGEGESEEMHFPFLKEEKARVKKCISLSPWGEGWGEGVVQIY